MKKIARIFWLFALLLLSACALPRVSSVGQPTVSPTLTPSATVSQTPAATITLSVAPSLTATWTVAASPSATESLTASAPLAETETLTPSWTPRNTRTPVPSPRTPLPTFDRKKIVTITPAPQAVCPTENPAVVSNFPKNLYIEPKQIVDYLNAGGALSGLEKQKNILGQQGKMIDLTGDGVKELLLSNISYFSIYRCINGVYEEDPLHIWVDGQFSGDLEEIEDVNQNGIPEIFFASFERHGEVSVFIYEWDGNAFRSLISVQQDVLNPIPNDYVMMENRYDIVDTNGDGLKEIVTVDDIGAYAHVDGVPFRRQLIILSWDGTHYVNLRPANFGPPTFRFQAAQDADRQVILGNYAQALALYQQVISSDSLDWWSSDRGAYIVRSQDPNDAPPTPYKDPEERPGLAAYAMYRRVVLQVYLGQMDKAQTEYAAMRKKFLPLQAGSEYVEMAQAFLDSYQASQNFQTACTDAVAYANEHPHVLDPVWLSDQNSLGYHHYSAEDMCPLLPQRP